MMLDTWATALLDENSTKVRVSVYVVIVMKALSSTTRLKHNNEIVIGIVAVAASIHMSAARCEMPTYANDFEKTMINTYSKDAQQHVPYAKHFFARSLSAN